MRPPRVLLLHNRYRVEGGEERSLALQIRAMQRAGVEHRLLERSSAESRRGRAAVALLRGGERQSDVAAAVRDLGATVAHAHNMLPLLGPKALSGAREAGTAVVLHLHNVRLFCATGFGERFGRPCARCSGRNTVPGLVLNCRRSLPEAAAYATALSLHQPRVIESVDRFVAPSEWAADRVAALGLPRDRVEALRHYLPDEAFVESSGARDGAYALVASRLSPEKGIGDAVAAAGAAGIPLRVAGEGPDRDRLVGLAMRTAAPVEFLGRLGPAEVREQLLGAAAVLMPSRYHEFSPYSALEAMAAGVPVVAMGLGGLPELLGEGRCVTPGDTNAFAGRLAKLWADPGLREAEGGQLLARARERHGEERYIAALLDLYGRVGR